MDFCSIASGSSGNCSFVGSDHTGILVDVGISGKKVTEGLQGLDRDPRELDGIFITHEHIDHIKSLGVLSRKYGLPIYATRGTLGAIKATSSMGKIPEGLFHEIREDLPVTIGDLTIQPFRISHDAAQPVGFRIEHGTKAIGIATDLGYYDEYTVAHLKGLDALLLEANHDVYMLQVGSYPYYLKQRILGERGHLSNETAGRLLCRLLHDGLQSVVLGHLSKENDYDRLAYETICSEVNGADNPYKASDFRIFVANRDKPSEKVIV